MAISYKLENDNIVELKNDEKTKSWPLKDFLDKKLKICKLLIPNFIPHEVELLVEKETKNEIEKQLKEEIYNSFSALFKSNAVVSPDMLDDFIEELEDKFENWGENIQKATTNYIKDYANSILSNKKFNGGNMFKTIKEAKAFTSHLDALANEIEGLTDVSGEMKKHLAFRLDRLSDLIEESVNKQASVEKEANGIGSGTWLHESDEKYMSTFGGTGSLMGDADEAKYMKEFKGDDHKEVLERKEPTEIAGAGAKKKQPSDNYNEAEVAKGMKIKAAVKSVLEKLNK